MDKIPFIQAKHYIESDDTQRTPKVIVLHSMESGETKETAENVANWFQNGGNVSSVHYCIDTDSIVQCVQCKDVAFGAKGFNRHGIHIELAGRANQTREQWLDDYSLPMLKLAAKLIGTILIPKYRINPFYLHPGQIQGIAKGKLVGVTGITTHRDITNALKIPGGHSDPGPNFPRQRFLWEIEKYVR